MNRYLMALCVFILVATGCSSQSPRELSLLPSKQEQRSFEEERLRKMQMVRVIDQRNGAVYEWDLGTATHNFTLSCFHQAFGNGDVPKDANLCDRSTATIQYSYCVGEKLLTLSGLSPATRTQAAADPDAGLFDSFSVPPQTAATNVALNQAAAAYFRSAMLGAAAMTDFSSCTVSEFVSPFRPNSLHPGGRRSAIAGAIFRDSYRYALVAQAGAFDNSLAEADAQLADAPSFQLRIARSFAGTSLSRAAAAHLMLGGSPGWQGDSSQGQCNSPRLAGPARKALGIFREAGVSPQDVLDEAAVSTEDLVDLHGLANGSVRDRLEYFANITIPSNQRVWEYYGLTAPDFGQARQALKDEITIFSRSLIRQLDDHTIDHGTVQKYKKFAATASPPTERDAAYWMALALSESSDRTVLTGGNWRGIAFGTEPPSYLYYSEPSDYCVGVFNSPGGQPVCAKPMSLTDLVDDGHSWANYILFLSKTSLFSSSDPDVQQKLDSDILAPLATLATSGDRAGRLSQCVDPSGSTATYALGYGQDDGLVMVPGEDNLECATRGNVDGAPCTLTDVLEFDKPLSDFPFQFSKGAANVSDFSVFNKPAAPSTSTEPIAQRWYLLAPRQSGAVPALGEWKALAGFVPYKPQQYPEFPQCRDIPIVPEAIQNAAKALAPSPEWCGRPTYECDYVRFDERLPLEDELTNDNDGVESSWKHYLSLAHTAAAQADALGQASLTALEAVDTNTEQASLRQQGQQERAAAELEKLQSICGTAVDPSLLIQALGPSLDMIVGINPCTTSLSDECIAGKSVLNWRSQLQNNPSLQPLAECLAKFDNTTEVGLGDTPLCKKDGKVTLGDESKNCDLGSCPNDGSVCVPKEKSLGFFHSPSVYPPTSDLICDAVRVLRKAPGNVTALDTLTSGTHFTTSNVRALGEATDIHLDYGGFVSVHIGGASYSTAPSSWPVPGSTTSIGSWPCAAKTAVDCTHGNGLFCQYWDCSNAGERAKANNRLYWAVLAGKLLTFDGNSPVPVIETPALLKKNVGPDHDPTHPGRVQVNGFAVDSWSNDRWRMFVPDNNLIPAQDPARIAVTIGATPGLNAAAISSSSVDVYQPNYYVAIERQPIEAMKDYPSPLLPFWQGMAPGALASGYVRRLLAGDPSSFIQSAAIALADPLSGPRISSYTQQSYDQRLYLQGLGPYFCAGPSPDPNLEPHASQLPGCPYTGALRDYMSKTYGLGHGAGTTEGYLPFYLGPNFANDLTDATPRAGFSLVTTFDPSTQDSKTALLDSLEMFCDGMGSSTDSAFPGGNCNGGQPPPINSVRDLDNLGAYVECLGDDITRRMVTTLFDEVPSVVVDGLVHSGKSNKAGGGELDTTVSNVREALDTIASSGPSIGGTVRRFGQDLRALRAQLNSFDISLKIDDVQLQSQQANQITTCLAATADAISSLGINSAANPASGPAAVAKAAVTCANSIAQIGFAVQIGQLQKDQNTSEREKAIAEFGGRFSDYVTALQTQSGLLSTAIEHVFGALTVIEGKKAEADRAVDNAIWLLSEQAAKEGDIASVLDNVGGGTRTRYERALSNAKRTASLARRAIEQRLGVSLDDMVDDLPLVPAPATWASKVCTTTGIDYKALSKTSGDAQAQNFADAFIGDYVDKLDQVVESYRLKNSFHEGTDTVVVSVRDDIQATRASCDVTSRNLLLNASNLSLAGAQQQDAGSSAWTVAGCATETLSGAGDAVPFTRSLPKCVTVSRTTEAPFLERELVATPLLGYSLTFGNGTSTCNGCGWNLNVALQQTVAVQPGRYRLSWYTSDSASASGFVANHYTTANASGIVRTSSGAVLDADGQSGFIAGTHGDWNRAYFVFEVPAQDSISVGFKYPGNGQYTIKVGAPMLERLDDPNGASSSFEPQSFIDTGNTPTIRAAVCEDTDGSVFREKKWSRGCLKLCPDGYASDCRERAQQECYWETEFNINQNGIDTGTLFGSSGFARGNFNYRIDTIGLNFVGTGLRTCQDSMLPTTCNAAGFVPYSIYHKGPYFVRNQKGVDFESFLFTAAIEHARGLGTERYLTNPMSQADSGLIQSYLRQEFQGRPLDGDFVIRVWDSDGLNFSAIQDVQVVLNYRYWTRFN